MKTALVTGSSRGIGRAVALRLASDGFRVIVHGSKPSEKLSETLSLIREAGGTAEAVTADLRDLVQTQTIHAQAGDVDVLVLNASLQIKRPWEQITPENAADQLNCNFVSSLLLAQAFVPHMREAGWGRIVAVGSVQEKKPHPDMLVYSASKAAQTNMIQSLSLQLAPCGITVNSVAPGVIYTDRNVEALSDPVYAAKVASLIPAGFWGKPEDCAGIVSLLCSEEGRYITGQSIYVDGGKSVQ